MKITLLRTSGAIAFALLAGCMPEVPEQTGTGGSSGTGAGGTTSAGGTTGGGTATGGTGGGTGGGTTTGGTGGATTTGGTGGGTTTGGTGGATTTGGTGGDTTTGGSGGATTTGGTGGGMMMGAAGTTVMMGGAGTTGMMMGGAGTTGMMMGGAGTTGMMMGGAGTTGDGGTTGSGGAGSFNPCPTNGDPCRILPLGDSITYGINQEGSYRIELFHKALGAQQKITYTGTLMNGPTMVDGVTFPRNHESTNGITIKGISDQITKNKTLNTPSDIIIVHIGTNDMYQNTATASPAMAPSNLGKLLDQLIAGMPNALIVVCKIIPLSLAASAVTTFNAAIPGVVQPLADAGKHVIVVDLSALPSGGMSSDNVHPNPTGYAWMGDHLYDAIGSLFPK